MDLILCCCKSVLECIRGGMPPYLLYASTNSNRNQNKSLLAWVVALLFMSLLFQLHHPYGESCRLRRTWTERWALGPLAYRTCSPACKLKTWGLFAKTYCWMYPTILMLKGHMACYISVLPSPEAGALKSLVMQYGSRSVRCSVLPSPGAASYRGRFPATAGERSGSQWGRENLANPRSGFISKGPSQWLVSEHVKYFYAIGPSKSQYDFLDCPNDFFQLYWSTCTCRYYCDMFVVVCLNHHHPVPSK